MSDKFKPGDKVVVIGKIGPSGMCDDGRGVFVWFGGDQAEIYIDLDRVIKWSKRERNQRRAGGKT